MKHSKFLAVACSASAMLSPFSTLLAQGGTQPESASALEEIVVTSSRIETPLRRIGTSVSVLNADEIQASGKASLLDVLRSLPSVAVSNTGGTGQVSTLRIRGEEGYRTLTLLDGMKLSDPSVTQVQPQLEHLLSSGIERVEILRGPQGLHYGADAGGVVNISTRHHDAGMNSRIDALAGAFGTRQLGVNLSGGNDKADFFLSGTRLDSEGFNARTEDTALADDDGYANRSLHARAGINVSENLRLDLVHRDVTGAAAYDGCYDPVVFTTTHHCESDFEQQASRLSATYQTSHGTHSIALANTATEREYFALNVSSFTSRGKLQRLEYIGTLNATKRFDVVYGVDLEEEKNNGEGRKQSGYYVEYLSDFSENLYLTAGVRRDDNDDFGQHTSYRLSGAYLIATGDGTLKFRGSYGTGFRAPSPYETSYNRGPFASPPASALNLEEELSTGHELAVEYYTDTGLHLEAVYFDQTVENAISFDLSAYSGYLQDAGESRSRGIELSGSMAFNAQLRLAANYTYNRTRRPDGEQRQLRPEDMANLSLHWNTADQRIQLAAYYRLAQDSFDALFGTPVALKDHDVIDLSASYALNETIEIYARIDNFSDSHYEEVLGYYTAGRAGYIGARLRF